MQEPLPMAIEAPPVAAGPPAGAPPAVCSGRRGADWRIDTRIRRVGLRGVAQARAALEATGGAGEGVGRSDAA